MQFARAKFIILAICLLAVYFFSNDFGQIDVEKASIVTAIAIDKETDGYAVSLQIAVPEPNTTSTNQKTVVTGRGQTISQAISEVSLKTGWYQKLAFCNVILIGEDLTSDNVMDFLDYFSRSLKIQSSALLAVTEGKAEEVLKTSTPLDNFSGFALQKIILQSKGSSIDVYSTDVKNFSIGYYSRAKCGYMPYITLEKANDSTPTSSSNQSDSKGQNQAPSTFKVNQTMLFKNGVNTGMLNENETLICAYLKKDRKDTELPINGVMIDGKKTDFMLSVIKSKSKVSVKIKDDKPVLKITQDFYVKIADETSDKEDLSKLPVILLPSELIRAVEDTLTGYLESLVETCKTTKTDIFNIDEKIYRHHHKYYDKLKEDFYKDLSAEISVTVHGQKGVKTKH